MHFALVQSAPPALASLLEGDEVALFLDFDGTLVELAQRPDAIAPLHAMADRLARLADRLGGRCALVSGRAIDDIERHIGRVPICVAGSHGSDIRNAAGERLGERAKTLPSEIEMALRAFAVENGVDYEHKAHGGALHYRGNPEMGERTVSFARSFAAQHSLKAQGGKCVIEILAGGSDKGSGVRALMATAPFSGAQPFFLGDDLTDEAGFAACQALGGAGILVGDRKETGAQYHLPNVSSVHTWLEI